MKKKTTFINILFSVSYLILIGLLVFNVVSLSNKYNIEEQEMIANIETRIHSALESRSADDIKTQLDEALEIYTFDIVVSTEKDVIYNSVPYDIGDSLLDRSHTNAIAKETQGQYGENQDIFLWYTIYQLNDSVFLNSFLSTLIFIIIIITLLILLTVYLLFRILFDPLRKIKTSIEMAKHYDFNHIEDEDDIINHEFKSFVSSLETDIDVVSRKHTVLERQLQSKRERLNNLVVMSRSMVHDLKTPLHQSILELDLLKEEDYTKEELLDLAEKMSHSNHNVLMDINSILNMLTSDNQRFEMDPQNLDIVEFVMRALNLFRVSVADKKLILDFDAPEHLYLVTDEATFILLVNNIISNMVTYSLEGTELNIFLDQDDMFTTLSFTNESTKENIDRMKDTAQLFNTVKDNDAGGYKYSSGNGLYIIRELAHMLKGQYQLITEGESVTIEVIFKNEN